MPRATTTAAPAWRVIPPWGLRTYFGAVFLGVFLALSAISFTALEFVREAARERLMVAIEAADRQAVAAMQRTARETLERITADLLVLRSLVEHYLPQAEGRRNLDLIGREFMQRHRGYDQMSVIALNGDEILRIDNRPAGPTLRSGKDLQNRAHANYFRAALDLDDDGLLISPLEPDREQDRIEEPLKPVIHVLAPVNIDGERRGFIALKFLGRRLLARIEIVGTAALGSPAAVSADGVDTLSTFTARAPDDLPAGPDFAERYPEAWATIQERGEGAASDGHGGLFVFSRYFPGTEAIPEDIGEPVTWTLPRGGDARAGEGGLYLISHVDAENLAGITDLGLGASSILRTLFLAVMLGLAWFVALRFAHLRGDTRRMHTLASRDALTGLLSRGEFDLRLQQVLAHARRYNRAMALLYVDIDNFKRINDELGHAAGDTALRRAADTLASTIRSSDLVGRIGGDEFAVVLTEIRGRHDTRAVADKLRERLNMEIELAGRIVHMGASVGAATYPEDAQSVDALYEAADRAMYRSKSRHRAAAATPAAGTP